MRPEPRSPVWLKRQFSTCGGLSSGPHWSRAWPFPYESRKERRHGERRRGSVCAESAGGRPSAKSRDGRLYLVFLFLVIAVYAVIGYGIYKVMEALA